MRVVLEPVAAFSWAPSNPRIGELVTFDASASADPDGSIVQFLWDFDGDGAYEVVTSEPVVTRRFPTAGEHPVALRVVDASGATADFAASVTVEPNRAPLAAFTWSPSSPVAGRAVTFDASGSGDPDGGIASYHWDFDGDGTFETSGTGPVATHTYAVAGERDVGLRVEDPDGATDVVTGRIRVRPNEAPEAIFVVSRGDPRVDEAVTFDASGSTDADGSIVRYRWDFDGDGTFEVTTADPRVAHAFASAGDRTVVLQVVDDLGATATTTHTITAYANEAPVAGFTWSPPNPTVGQAVTFDASVSGDPDGSIASYRWDFDGDGTFEVVGADATTSRAFTEPGPREVRLQVVDDQGAVDVAAFTVEVRANRAPIASFGWAPAAPRAGEEVAFDATASRDPDGAVAEYRWDFDGDGGFDLVTASPTASHAYATGGARQVRLEVVDGPGATASVTRTIPVRANQGPSASFTWSPSNPRVRTEVTFDASGSRDPDGRIAEYRWDFDGDGAFDATLTGPIARHTFSSPGAQTVRLQVIDGDGAPASLEATVSVRANQPPPASFTWSPSMPRIGEAVTFDASGASDPDGSIVEYRWDFDGDGSIDTTTPGPVVTYVFSGTGPRAVRLEVVDDLGEMAAVTQSIPVIAEPTARFTWSPSNPRVGQEVTFDASDSTDPDATITEYRWDFDGDGTYEVTTSSPTTTRTFLTAGERDVVLQVVDATGATDTVTGTVDVQPNREPTADFTWTPANPGVGDEVTFDASASIDPDGAVVEYRWDFDGDGVFDTTETDPTTTHRFSTPGGRTVTLQVADAQAATDTSTQTVTVRANLEPAASFTWSPSSPKVGEQVTFDGSGSIDPDGSIAEYRWDLDGDGGFETVGSSPTATHTYASAGDRVVALQVVDEDGGGDTTSATVSVRANREPAASFTWAPASPNIGEDVTFDASASLDPDGTIAEYRWDFDGDGTFETTGSGPVATHAFSTGGDTDVTLQVVDDDGAEASTTQTVLVQPNEDPAAGFTWSPAIPVVGQTVTFDASTSTDADGSIVEYRWDFDGDGGYEVTGPDSVTTHAFSSPGAASVTLQVVDALGATDTETRQVIVRQNRDPSAAFTWSPSNPRINQDVTFDASSSADPDGSIVEYRWDFDGDGTYEVAVSDPVTTHAFSSVGDHTVTLQVVDNSGETDTAEETVSVNDNRDPTASFTWSPSIPTRGQPAIFDASASVDPNGAIVEYRWDFDGDGTVDATRPGPVISHTFASPGNFNVTLEVVDSDGATDSETERVRVRPPTGNRGNRGGPGGNDRPRTGSWLNDGARVATIMMGGGGSRQH